MEPRGRGSRGAGPTCLAPPPQILAALPVDWRGTHLLACSCLRAVFIPLFILCVYPSGTPALRHPAWPCIFSLLVGISNGYFGSVPMIVAAGNVGPTQRELAGKAPLGQRPACPRDASRPSAPHRHAGTPRPTETEATQPKGACGFPGPGRPWRGGLVGVGSFLSHLVLQSTTTCVPGAVPSAGDSGDKTTVAVLLGMTVQR